MIDSLVKYVTGIVRLRGATDNTAIGNVGDRLKVDSVSSIPQELELAREHLDAYHKIRVTQPTALFDLTFKNSIRSDYFSSTTATGGAVTHDSTLKAIKLSTTTSSGSKAIAQSYINFHFHDGKSHLVNAFVLWGAIATNNRKRLGYFNDNNGVYFETDGTAMYAVTRSNATGSVVNTRTASVSWNIDKLDGTGTSGATADPSKVQMMIIDFSNGLVRFGIYIGEQIVYTHYTSCSNVSTIPCVNSLTLPIRFEIENTGTTSGANSLYVMSCAVNSEGGDRSSGSIKVVSTGTTTTSVSTTNKIVAGMRLNSTSIANGASLQPVGFNIFPASGSTILFYRVILRPSYSAGSNTWVAFSDVAEVIDTGSALATYQEGTGIDIDAGYILLGSGRGNGNNVALGSGGTDSIRNDKWLGYSATGVADELILVVRTVSSTGSILFTGQWMEHI